jgi:DNA-binding HxlR family transcriptional regulator
MKRYDQYCPIAHALGAIGERWSLLIVRDLMQGAKRYTDLADGLPGIGTNVLASRLRDLEQAGLVTKRRLPPPAATVTVYELTDYGRDLEEALQALARWGARTLGPPGPEDEIPPGWSLDALRAMFDREEARGVDALYELRIDAEQTTVRVADGALVEVRNGPAEDADLLLETDMTTFYGLLVRTISPWDAIADGRVRVEGDSDELERLLRIFNLESRSVALPTPV